MITDRAFSYDFVTSDFLYLSIPIRDFIEETYKKSILLDRYWYTTSK